MEVAILLLFTFVTVLQGQNITRPMCLKEEFSCHDGTCIPDSLLCNGISDCASGLDELVCITRPSTGCPANERPCGISNECFLLGRECDGIRDCTGGEDERNCSKRQDSPCLVSQFECSANVSLTGPIVPTCIPMRFVCDCTSHCSGATDEVNCASPSFILQPTLDEIVHGGGNVALVCTVEGYPLPTVTWLKNMEPIGIDTRYTVVSNNGSGALYIRNVSVFDEGSYSCVATQLSNDIMANQSTRLTVVEPNRTSCESIDGGKFASGEVYYDLETLILGKAIYASADITFIVDESASMVRAHEWIKELVPKLDTAIRGVGIGIGNRPNQYALVGFGRVSSPRGLILTQLTSVEGFLNATNDLRTDGLFEDGYSAIVVALDSITQRVNTSQIFVLVTDEERQSVQSELDRALVERRLRESGITLNCVVRQGFLYNGSDNSSFAFGLTSNRTAFSADSSTTSGFRTHQNGVKHPSHLYRAGNTYTDYVELAFSVGGAAWYIDIITLTNVPFTNAFIQVKIDELMLQKRCLRCTCGRGCDRVTNVPLDACMGLTSSLVVRISPSKYVLKHATNLTLTCQAFTIPSNLSLNYTFMGGRFGADLCTSRAVCYNNTAIIANVTISDTGLYTCTVDAGNSLRRVAGSLISVHESPTVSLSISDQLRVDKPFMLTCISSGSPSPIIRWTKIAGNKNMSSMPIIQGTRSSSVLFFSSALTEHSGTYQCTAINCAGMATNTINVTVTYANCNPPDGSVLPSGEFSTILHTPTLGADIILMVDESGSMMTQHRWITNMTIRLNDLLHRINIGVREPNLFGVVGFGSRYSDGKYSRVIEYNGQQFVNSTDVDKLIKQLSVEGNNEDGYAAIQLAVNQFRFRENAATQFILISDENRDVLQSDLNSSIILSLIKEQDAILNVAVSESFETSLGQQAFGIDSTNRTFLYNPFKTLDFVSGGKKMKDSAHSTTNIDYTQLALSTGGAAWDLSVLMEGGSLVDSFTRAFVTVKANEIFQQVSNCLNCSCNDVSGLYCIKLPLSECNLTEVFMALSAKEVNRSINVIVEPVRQTHIEGIGEAIITCSIQGGMAAGAIQWTYNGGRSLPPEATVVTNNTVSILTLSPLRTSHKGSYTCIVESNALIGTASGVIEVIGQTLISLSPSESHIIPGTIHSLTCNASNVSGNISWIFNYSPSLPSNVVVTSVSNSLSVLTIMQASHDDNHGRYTCIFRGAMISSSVDSLVYVSDLELVVTVDPTNVTVAVGSMASLVCRAECCKGVNLTWSKSNGQTLPSHAMSIPANNGQELTLKFNNVTLDDCDAYICQANFRGDTRYGVSVLTVYEPFHVSLNTNPLVSLVSGLSQYYIACNAIGDQASLWQWTFNVTNNLTRMTNFDGRRSILVMCDLSLENTGLYTCTATTASGMIASASTFIQVVCNNTDCISISSSVVSQVTSVASTIQVTESLFTRSTSFLHTSHSLTESLSPAHTTSAEQTPSPTVSSIQTSFLTESIVQSPSSTESMVQTPSSTESNIQTPSSTESMVQSMSYTESIQTPSSTESMIQTTSSTESMVQTPSSTESMVQSPSYTESMIQTPSSTESNIQIPSLTESMVQSLSSTESIQTPSSTESMVQTLSSTASLVQSPSYTESMIQTPSSTESKIQTPSSTESMVQSLSSTESIQTPSTESLVQTPSSTTSLVQSPSFTELMVQTPSSTESNIRTPSSTESMVQTPSSTASLVQSPSYTESMIQTPSLTESMVLSPSSMVQTPSSTESMVQSPSYTSSTMLTSSFTESVAQSPSPTESVVRSPSSTKLAEKTLSPSESVTKSPSLPESMLESISLTKSSIQTLSLTRSAMQTSFHTESVAVSPSPIDSVAQSPLLTESLPDLSSFTVVVSSTQLISSSVSPSRDLSSILVSPTPTDIPLLIFTSPQSIAYVIPGTTFNITCTVNRPDASLRWVYSSVSSDNIMVTTVNKTTLLIKIEGFKVSNVGSYRCEAILDNGSVNKSKTVDVFDGTLTVTVQSESYSLDPGDDLNVTCSTNIPVDNLTWIYLALRDQPNKLPSNIISRRISRNMAILVIKNFVDLSNRGAYQCAAEKCGTICQTVSKQIQINQRDSLNMTALPESYITGAGGDRPDPIVYTCTVTCTCGGAKVTWVSASGMRLQSHVKVTTDVTQRMANLIFRSLQVSDSGTYTCIISHPTLGTLKRNVTLSVLPPPVLNVFPDSATVERGANFTFECISDRAAQFTWTYQTTNGKLPSGVAVLPNGNSTFSQIRITNVAPGVNTGAYYCHALFTAGDSLTDTGNIVQKSIAAIKFNPETPQTFRIGSRISIDCVLDCSCSHFLPGWINLPPGFRQELHTSRRRRTLIADTAAATMSGNYTCQLVHVRDNVVEVKRVFTIIVN